MADFHSSRAPLSPAELVADRIDENRFFEARFLFRKFSEEIDPAVREQLRGQLETRIARAEKTFAQGELLERAGKFEQAGKVYADLAVMVIDYPSLDEVRQRVEVAIKLGPLGGGEHPDPKIPVAEPTPSVIQPETPGFSVSGPSFFRHGKVALFVVFSLLTILGTVSFRIFFRSQREPVGRPTVQAEAGVVRNEGPASRLAESLPVPEPAAVESESTGVDGKTTGAPLSAEAETGEADVKLPSPLVKEKSDELQQQGTAREESASGPISDPRVFISVADVGSAEGEGKTVAAPVQETLQKEVLSHAVDEQAFGDEAIREQRNSSLSPGSEIKEKPERSEGTIEVVEDEGRQETTGAVPDVQVSGQAVEHPDDTSGITISDPAGPVEAAKIYTVQEGDTLETIAAEVYGHRFKWSLLVAANQEKLGKPPYVLLVGMQLRVPPLESSTPENRIALLNDDGTYTVQSGDSLGSIALKLYGASWKWNTLYRLNHDRLTSPTALRVGQRLLVNTENIPDGEDKDPLGE